MCLPGAIGDALFAELRFGDSAITAADAGPIKPGSDGAAPIVARLAATSAFPLS